MYFGAQLSVLLDRVHNLGFMRKILSSCIIGVLNDHDSSDICVTWLQETSFASTRKHGSTHGFAVTCNSGFFPGATAGRPVL